MYFVFLLFVAQVQSYHDAHFLDMDTDMDRDMSGKMSHLSEI